MSALIKAGAAGAVRDFAALRDQAARIERAPVPVDPVEAERDALRAELARIQRELGEADERADKAVLEAHAKGLREGQAESETRESDRIELLREALAAAAADFGARLDLLDGLAPRLVRAALGKLFDDPDRWSEMAEAMLARQLARLRRSSIVELRISPEDFAEVPDSLPAGVQVVRDPELGTGACSIRCRLGQIDLDVRAHWAALDALLETIGSAA